MWQQWTWWQATCSRQYVGEDGILPYIVWESLQPTTLIHFLNQSSKEVKE